MKRKLIDGVHNYCDRWCERCHFVERCFVGLSERERLKRDPEGKNWMEDVRKNFEDARKWLEKALVKFGIDPEELDKQPLPEPDPNIEAMRKKMREKSMRYFRLTDGFFKKNEAFFDEHSAATERKIDLNLPIDVDELFMLGEAVSTIRWFVHFVGVKAERAISGLEDWNEWADPLQSDGNGSAKICHIAIRRSLGSWEVIRRNFPDKTDEILDIIVQLRDIQRDMQGYFPDWEKFHRPGFDDEPAYARFEAN